jgi:hypothetical protein
VRKKREEGCLPHKGDREERGIERRDIITVVYFSISYIMALEAFI